MAGQFLDYAEARSMARRFLPQALFGYIDGGTEAEWGLRALRAGFDGRRVVPRVLRGAMAPDLSAAYLDRRRASPFVMAPTALAGLVRHNGEAKLARAARDAGIPVCLSTQSSTSVEDVASDAAGAELWFQLYVWRDRSETWRLLDRVAECGIETLLLTVDTPVSPKKVHNARNGFSIPLRPSARLAVDFARHWRWTADTVRHGALPSFANYPLGGAKMTQVIADSRFALDTALDMAFVSELRRKWRGKLLLKGILHPDDAHEAVSAGCDGVVVSSHGGRNLDSAVTPVEVLARVRDAVPHATLLADSGVQRGSDAAQLLAQGADGVLLGRAPLYGLAAGGEAGVGAMITIMNDELQSFMAFAGAKAIENLTSLEWRAWTGDCG